ncbi:MAG: monovalent cation/H+ antiporter complex subunit F [Pseudomonadota bacterium]
MSWPSAVLAGLALMLVLGSVLLGLIPVVRGSEPAQRMLAAQLLGTGGVGVLIALAVLMNAPGLVDVALVFAGLAAVAVVAFVQRIWQGQRGQTDD